MLVIQFNLNSNSCVLYSTLWLSIFCSKKMAAPNISFSVLKNINQSVEPNEHELIAYTVTFWMVRSKMSEKIKPAKKGSVASSR